MMYKILVVIISISLATTPVALGHGSGIVFEETVDGYIMDIDIEAFEVITNTPVAFSFSIRSQDYTEKADYTNVEVEIKHESGEVVVSENEEVDIPEFGLTQTEYEFSNGGSYDMQVEFFNEDDLLAGTTVSFDVTEGSGAGSVTEGSGTGVNPLVVGAIIVVSTAVGGGIWFFRKKQLG